MNKPKIRFQGFTEEWEQRKLREITLKIGSGKTPHGGKSTYLTEGIPLIRSQNINNDRVDFREIAYIDDDTDSSMENSRVITNDVLLNITGASIGRSAVYKALNTANVNQHVCIIRPQQEYSSNFLQLCLGSNIGQKQISESQAGGGREGINFQQIGKMSFMFPEKGEQEKIGQYFSDIDDLITLHQRKREEVLKLKKYMLQKMFPQNGNKVPEIRFEEFNDDWEQRKLGNLGTLKNGMNFSKDAMGHGYAFINLQNVFGNNVVDIHNLGLAEASEKQLIDYSLQKGDVLFVRSSVKLEGVGESALVPKSLENTTYSGFIIRFRDEYGLNNDFKKYVFTTKNVRNQIISQATNSANKNISQTVLENLTFKVPIYEEQKKVGEYFSELDHLITLHQQKCEKLQKLKKFMLQNMFL